MQPEQWDALVRGEKCPACAEVRSGATEEGHLVARLQLSHLRLMHNQFVPGYCVLVCTRHVPEPYHLSPDEQARFFQDLVRATQALDRVFAPVKMNVNLLGNLVPHLHAHLVPRYYGDPAPGRPIDPGQQVVTLPAGAYEERVRQIQAALQLSECNDDILHIR
ncbi:MAG: HIT family protein [Thermomicrobiales bacterium]